MEPEENISVNALKMLLMIDSILQLDGEGLAVDIHGKFRSDLLSLAGISST